MEYVEKLEAEHVLTAMQSLGWEPGKKPPTYVATQAKCRELFGNGGDGNRIKELREQAIAQALHEIGATTQSIIDTSPPPRLPEELQAVLDGLANDFAVRLGAFDRAASSYLIRSQSDAEAVANSRVKAVRREAAEHAVACDEEISAALSTIETRDLLIADVEAKLAAALTAAAHAEGRASALSDQVAAQATRIAELEKELQFKKAGSKPIATKQPAVAAKPEEKNSSNKQGTGQKKSDTRAEIEGNPPDKALPVQVALEVGGKE